MNKKISTLSFFVGLSCLPMANAYELYTHASLTNQAQMRSVLNDPQFFGRLGIEPPRPDAPYQDYYDMSESTVRERKSSEYEEKIIVSLGVDPLSMPAGWLMRGAIREDDLAWVDLPGLDPYWNGPNPKDETDSPPFWRVMNHFYDPAYNRPLTLSSEVLSLFGSVTGDPTDFRAAPNWATGTADTFVASAQPEANRRNHFTVLDAREAMYRALTGKTWNGDDAGPNGTPTTEAVRKAYWATVFRALGDVLHLNQDMAQPQHTRNDAHAGVPGLGHASIYESYIECRTTLGAKLTSAAGDAGMTAGNCAALNYGSYPIPDFDKYGDFFSTREGNNGRGLADYSNRGFFTAGTNLGSSGAAEYPAPSNNHGDYTPEQVGVGEKYGFFSVNAPLHILKGEVPDLVAGSATGVPLTTEGLWYQPLADFSSQGNANAYGYTLTRPNYDAMADLLIPRAVAYSAGLLNYFFRGQMSISLPAAGVYGIVDHAAIPAVDPGQNFSGFGKIRLRLKKVAPADEEMSGKLQAVLKFHRNLCYSSDLTGYPPTAQPGYFPDGCRSKTGEIVLSDALYNMTVTNTDQELEFIFPQQLPINATDVELQLVFRGTLGNEQDAVAVETKNLSEPSFYMTLNSLDYIHVGTSVYTRDEINADAGLLSAIQPQSCVVNGQLSSSCFADTTMSSTLTINGGAQVQINLPGPRTFSRIVYLGDAGANVQMYQSGKCYYSGTDFAMRWDNQYYPIFQLMRGISRWGSSNCVFNGDSAYPMVYDPAVMSTIFPVPTPLPVTITGY